MNETSRRPDADDAALGADGPIESGIDASDDDVPVPLPVRHRNTKASMDTCLHEAGHAMAHWYIGVPFAQVSVGIRSLPGSGGMLSAGSVTGFTFVPQREDWLALAAAGDVTALDRGRMATEMEMFCAYAGPFAQARHVQSYLLRPPGGVPVRRRSRLDLDTILFGGGGECDWALIETDIADWPEGVAMAITARRLACAFVRSPAAWGAVLEVAQRLQCDAELTWDEVGAIASTHFGRGSPERDAWIPHWSPMASAVRAGFLPPEPDVTRLPGLLHLEP